MSKARKVLLSERRQLLEQKISDFKDYDLAGQAFAKWVLGEGPVGLDVDNILQRRNVGYREVAALGYLSAIKKPSCDYQDELKESLDWLSKRPITICGDSAGFVSDPIGLLGASLGSKNCGCEKTKVRVRDWIKQIEEARIALPKLENWEECLMAAVLHVVGRPVENHLSQIPETADCRLILRARSVLPYVHPAQQNEEEDHLTSILFSEDIDGFCVNRSLLLASAYDNLVSSAKTDRIIQSSEQLSMPMRVNKTALKAFVSYAWETDDPCHQQEAVRFANQLREYGIDATIDMFEQNPAEGLPIWMLNRIRKSDFVLMIITETYRKRCEGDEEPGRGKGAKWEGGIVTRSIYESEFQNSKFIPVLFGTEHLTSIPTMLAGSTYYNVRSPERFEELIRYMTNQPSFVPGPIGSVPKLPPKDV